MRKKFCTRAFIHRESHTHTLRHRKEIEERREKETKKDRFPQTGYRKNIPDFKDA